MSFTTAELFELIELEVDVTFEWAHLLEGRDDEDPLIIEGLPGVLSAVPQLHDIRKGQEARYVVLKWEPGDDAAARFFRKSGCYTSWDGYTWDGPLEEVFPREVTRVEWVKV